MTRPLHSIIDPEDMPRPFVRDEPDPSDARKARIEAQHDDDDHDTWSPADDWKTTPARWRCAYRGRNGTVVAMTRNVATGEQNARVRWDDGATSVVWRDVLGELPAWLDPQHDDHEDNQ